MGLFANPGLRKPSHWVIFSVCLAAMVLSIWLTIQKWSGQIDSLAGCGKGSGCENVLGSKWSVIFGSIPVSLLSSILYLGVILSFFVRHGFAVWFRVTAAFMMFGAALWYTSLQLFVLKTICPYCMVMHSLGTLLALAILYNEIKKKSARPSSFAVGSVVAILSVLILALIQYLGPEPPTHRLDEGVDLSPDHSNIENNPHIAGEGKLVSFFDGKKSYRVTALPHLGPADAKHVIVKYFDYTCDACRETHDYLENIRAKFPADLAVIVLPVPLNRSCNPRLPAGVKDHKNACELARLALQVWMAAPEKFPEFHQWLFQYHQQPFEIAEAMAYSLVDEGKMNAISKKDIEALLGQNVKDYGEFARDTPVMPKLILADSLILQGKTRDEATLEALLVDQLGLGER